MGKVIISDESEYSQKLLDLSCQYVDHIQNYADKNFSFVYSSNDLLIVCISTFSYILYTLINSQYDENNAKTIINNYYREVKRHYFKYKSKEEADISFSKIINIANDTENLMKKYAQKNVKIEVVISAIIIGNITDIKAIDGSVSLELKNLILSELVYTYNYVNSVTYYQKPISREDLYRKREQLNEEIASHMRNGYYGTKINNVNHVNSINRTPIKEAAKNIVTYIGVILAAVVFLAMFIIVTYNWNSNVKTDVIESESTIKQDGTESRKVDFKTNNNADDTEAEETTQAYDEIPTYNGEIIIDQYPNSRYAPFKIQTTTTDDNIYYVLLANDLDNIIISFIVEGGNNVELNVPLGTYKLYYAYGDTWYGTEYLFGLSTKYVTSDEKLKFYDDGTYYNGHTITLYKVTNGNFDTESIGADSFPH